LPIAGLVVDNLTVAAIATTCAGLLFILCFGAIVGAGTAVAAVGEAAALLSIPVRASTATITILIASSRLET
jgi:hypothetical protein